MRYLTGNQWREWSSGVGTVGVLHVQIVHGILHIHDYFDTLLLGIE